MLSIHLYFYPSPRVLVQGQAVLEPWVSAEGASQGRDAQPVLAPRPSPHPQQIKANPDFS